MKAEVWQAKFALLLRLLRGALLPSLLLFGMLSGALLATQAAAQPRRDDESATRAQLEQLSRDIAEITKALRRDETRRNQLQDQLRKAETELADIRKQVATTEQHIAAAQQQLTDLTEQRAALIERRDGQRERIGEELRSAWQFGEEGQVKMLLNQEQPGAVARMTMYYRYLLAARSEKIAEFRQTLQELEVLERELVAARTTLDRERSELQTRQQRLAAAQAERERAVASLAASIRERGASLAQMQRDREELETLLGEIEIAVKDMQIPENFAPFTTARGKMPWPVTGKHANSFGTARNQGKMRWQGINILAERGTTVRAIHHGRVVYADWLRGSGLLLVIDHGEGYMSLYAHNESLLRDVGEWVTTGSPISEVGASGGLDRTALYFEIRQGGKPTNPAPWCAG